MTGNALALVGLAVVSLSCAGSAASDSEKDRAARYRSFATRFGEALLAEDYAAAYGMTARMYQASTTQSAFEGIVRRARADYGRPDAFEVGTNTVMADGPLGEGLSFPAGVPVGDRRARMVVTMQGAADAQGYRDAVYEVWINVIDEGGRDGIVTVEVPGINF